VYQLLTIITKNPVYLLKADVQHVWPNMSCGLTGQKMPHRSATFCGL